MPKNTFLGLEPTFSLDLKIISSREERDLPDHGITMDFTVMKISMEHQLNEPGHVNPLQEQHSQGGGGGDDDEALLSAAFSQQSSISIGHDSNYTGTQSSDMTSSQPDVTSSQSDVTSSQSVSHGSDGARDQDGYTTVFLEHNPNSPFVSRPIFRLSRSNSNP